jgi:hypothetical protein
MEFYELCSTAALGCDFFEETSRETHPRAAVLHILSSFYGMAVKFNRQFSSYKSARPSWKAGFFMDQTDGVWDGVVVNGESTWRVSSNIFDAAAKSKWSQIHQSHPGSRERRLTIL